MVWERYTGSLRNINTNEIWKVLVKHHALSKQPCLVVCRGETAASAGYHLRTTTSAVFVSSVKQCQGLHKTFSLVTRWLCRCCQKEEVGFYTCRACRPKMVYGVHFSHQRFLLQKSKEIRKSKLLLDAFVINVLIF